jgi:diacylglycerol kinase (ATP)
MSRWLVAVNRSAGRKATDPARVSSVLEDHGVDVDLVAPGSRSEMVEAIESAALSGCTHFAVAGGDGTMNLLVNTLVPLGIDPLPVVALLPLGTGCDLLRTFALPQDLAGAVSRLLTDDTYVIDVASLEGSWGTRYFVNVAQTGVGAAAASTAAHIGRRFGAVRYPMAFAARLPMFPRANVKVTTERRSVESEALAVIIANGQFFAGGWNVAPRATLMDGVLDIQIIDARKTAAPALVPKVIKGTHLSDRSVRRFTAAEFRVETIPSWPVECDGDMIGNTTLSGRVVRAALKLKI